MKVTDFCVTYEDYPPAWWPLPEKPEEAISTIQRTILEAGEKWREELAEESSEDLPADGGFPTPNVFLRLFGGGTSSSLETVAQVHDITVRTNF